MSALAKQQKRATPEKVRHEHDNEDNKFDKPTSLQWFTAWVCVGIVT